MNFRKLCLLRLPEEFDIGGSVALYGKVSSSTVKFASGGQRN